MVFLVRTYLVVRVATKNIKKNTLSIIYLQRSPFASKPPTLLSSRPSNIPTVCSPVTSSTSGENPTPDPITAKVIFGYKPLSWGWRCMLLLFCWALVGITPFQAVSSKYKRATSKHFHSDRGIKVDRGTYTKLKTAT